MTLILDVVKEGKFTYSESFPESNRPPILLLHGLMGALSNFKGIISNLGEDYNVVVPLLPIFEMPLREVGLEGLLNYVEEFVEYKGYKDFIILGNSLGGHLCQLYALKHGDIVAGMVLTGSSGLFESAMGNSFPKRGDRKYIREKTEMVFHNPNVATEELVDEVYDTVNDLGKGIRIVKTAKSAIRHNLEGKLKDIKVPTLLIWGSEDSVTPFWVGEKFHELLPNSRLIKYEECGHAPMMEFPDRFNNDLRKFVEEIFDKAE